jgi:prolipoprotein diacylglyceryltransferase
VTSFGALVAIAALVGLLVFRRELARRDLPESALDAAVFGLIGGFVGAKLLWVLEQWGEEPVGNSLRLRRVEL